MITLLPRVSCRGHSCRMILLEPHRLCCLLLAVRRDDELNADHCISPSAVSILLKSTLTTVVILCMTCHKFRALPLNGACYRACMDVTLTLHALPSRHLYQYLFQRALSNDICFGKHDVQHVVHTEGLHLCNGSLDSEMTTTACLRPVASQRTPHACEGSKSSKSTTTRNSLGLPTQSGQAVQQYDSQTHCLCKASRGPAHSVLQLVVELGQQVSAASVPHKTGSTLSYVREYTDNGDTWTPVFFDEVILRYFPGGLQLGR